MTAEKRLKKVKNHLEIAYNHEMFEVDELDYGEDYLIAEINMIFRDEVRRKKFVFGSDNSIIGVKDKGS